MKDSKKEPASEAKERIENEAHEYCNNSPQFIFEYRGYITGATAEYNRAQEEITLLKVELESALLKSNEFSLNNDKLKAELEMERELRKEILKELQSLDRLYYAGYTIYPNDLKPLIAKAKN